MAAHSPHAAVCWHADESLARSQGPSACCWWAGLLLAAPCQTRLPGPVCATTTPQDRHCGGPWRLGHLQPWLGRGAAGCSAGQGTRRASAGECDNALLGDACPPPNKSIQTKSLNFSAFLLPPGSFALFRLCHLPPWLLILPASLATSTSTGACPLRPPCSLLWTPSKTTRRSGSGAGHCSRVCRYESLPACLPAVPAGPCVCVACVPALSGTFVRTQYSAAPQLPHCTAPYRPVQVSRDEVAEMVHKDVLPADLQVSCKGLRQPHSTAAQPPPAPAGGTEGGLTRE